MKSNIIEYENLNEETLLKALNFDSRIKSPGTAYTYTKLILKFIKWVDTNSIPRNLVNKRIVIKYIEGLKSEGYKNTSLNNNLKAIKRFYRLLQEKDPSIINPIEGIEYFNEPKFTSKNKFLNEEQLSKIYSILKADSSERGLRNYAIFNTLLMTGLRASELCNLKFSDIIFENEKPVEIKVVGKGDKERYVEFDENLLDPILAYHKTGGLLKAEYLFYTIPTNSSQKRNPIDRFDLSYTIKSIGRKAGIQNLHPHTLRHTFATHALKKGASLVAVKNRLGHSSISLTESVYIHDDDKCLEHLRFGFI